MTDELGLSVGSQLYEGWQTIKVTCSLEQLARTFDVGYVAQATKNEKPVPIFEGNAVRVKAGDDVVIDGYVDEADSDYDSARLSASVSGRSKTGDLVDCSAVHKSGAWKDATLLTIAADICQPFGIDVSIDGSAPAKFRRFALSKGETAHEAIDRAAKMRGFMTLTTSDGNLRLTRLGSKKTSTVLEYGKNIKTGKRRGSWKDRFSKYTLVTQTAGDDQYYGEQASQIKKEVSDSRVNRYRPLIIMAENEDTGSELEARARWECNVRAGKSRRATYQVVGWRDDDGDLWEPNTLVRVKDPRFELDSELLIVGVTYEKSIESGTLTTIELCDKAGFDVQPLPPAKKKGGGLNDFYEGES